jgi:hypothetical protein
MYVFVPLPVNQTLLDDYVSSNNYYVLVAGLPDGFFSFQKS